MSVNFMFQKIFEKARIMSPHNLVKLLWATVICIHVQRLFKLLWATHIRTPGQPLVMYVCNSVRNIMPHQPHNQCNTRNATPPSTHSIIANLSEYHVS